MSDEWVNVRGMRVPLQMEKAGEYGFRPKPGMDGLTPPEPPINHYRKSCMEVGAGMLRDASSNRHGYIEAGYCLGSDEGDGTAWFISIDKI